MNQNMMNDKEQRIERLGNRFMTSCAKGVHALRYTLVMVMMVMGVTGVWGQTDYTGVKYIASDGTPSSGSYSYSVGSSNNFYLVPTCEPPAADNKSDVYHDETGAQEPFLTTYKIGQDKEAVWVLKQVTDDEGFYYVIHAKTNKFVVYDPYFSDYSNASTDGKWRRKCMHLQAMSMDSPSDDNAKFIIGERENAYYFIPKAFKDITPGRGKPYIFWNISDKNQNFRQGQGTDYRGGLVGLYGLDTGKDELDRNSRWKFESTLLAAPTISDVDALTSKVTITDNNSLPSGYNIRYTTNGDDPTASSTIMQNGIYDVTVSCTLKVVLERYGVVLTEVAEKSVAPVSCATPVISFDYTTSEVSITCATAGTTIYYTTNGGTPTTGSTEYNGPFSVTSPTTIKAIATHATLPNSEVATLEITQVATPTEQR